jgi:hypothetical protein
LDVTVTATILPTPTIHPDMVQMVTIDKTFHQSDLRYRLKPDLVKKCVEQGILHHYLEDGNGKKKGQVMVVSDVWVMVDKLFLDWHKRDSTTMHDSLGFQPDIQEIDRKRKKTTNDQKKDAFEEIGRKVGKFKKARTPVKKYVLAATEVLKMFPKGGFYIVGSLIQCPCSNKVINRDHVNRRS